MRCKEARQLFDAYLDGELSGALATELGAHRVHCAKCRRELALLEVSGHIVASDRDNVELGREFPDRLLACMDDQPIAWTVRLRRRLYVAGPLAAAAVIVLAFFGAFDRREPRVAGQKIERRDAGAARGLPQPGAVDDVAGAESADVSLDERLLEDYFTRTQRNIEAKRQSGEALQEALDLTVSQWLDILNQQQDASLRQALPPGSDVAEPESPPAKPSTGSEDVEDL